MVGSHVPSEQSLVELKRKSEGPAIVEEVQLSSKDSRNMEQRAFAKSSHPGFNFKRFSEFRNDHNPSRVIVPKADAVSSVRPMMEVIRETNSVLPTPELNPPILVVPEVEED